MQTTQHYIEGSTDAKRLYTFILLDAWPELLPSVRRASLATSPIFSVGISPDQIRTAHLCMTTGEQVSGTNRICYYQCPGSGAAITVPMSSLCPVSINQ